MRYFPLPYVPIARGAFVMPAGGAAAGAVVAAPPPIASATSRDDLSLDRRHQVSAKQPGSSRDYSSSALSPRSPFSLKGLLPPRENGTEENGGDAPVPPGEALQFGVRIKGLGFMV